MTPREVSPPLVKALKTALADPASKGFVTRADGLAKFRYKWGGSVVQFCVDPKRRDKVSFVVQHAMLPDAAAVAVRRAEWKQALAALAAHVPAR